MAWRVCVSPSVERIDTAIPAVKPVAKAVFYNETWTRRLILPDVGEADLQLKTSGCGTEYSQRFMGLVLALARG
jgi:hypothetical protein